MSAKPFYRDDYGRGAWPRCYACGEDLVEEEYEVFGNTYCRECAEEIVRDEHLQELIDDFLADRKSTPTYMTSAMFDE